MDKDPRFWSNRGYLPHFDKAEYTQFITFRLADSIPQEVLDRWRIDLEARSPTLTFANELSTTWIKTTDRHIGGTGAGIGSMIQETLLKFDGERYRLISWVLMPNHGHILLTPMGKHTLPEIMHSIKSYTAHQANKILNRKGQFWSREYFDRFTRDSKHFASTIAYIENNPVKARLCKEPRDWPYGSAFYK